MPSGETTNSNFPSTGFSQVNWTGLCADKSDDTVIENNGISVLIVDDERVNRAIIGRMLKKKGFTVTEAENGFEAIALIESDSPDMVLLDIVMPNMDGFQVLAEMQKRGLNDTPVIMVTASDESETIVRAFDLGANDYITKPVDPAVTIARINTHVQFKASQVALRKSEERYSLVAQGTNDGIWDWDLQKNEVFYSPRWYAMFAIEDQSGPSLETWWGRVHPEDRARVRLDLENHLSALTPQFETEMRMRHSSGSYLWTLCRGVAVRDEQNAPLRMAGSLTDITEGKVADALTGLPNRVLFQERLGRCFNKQKRNANYRFALLFLDLDNFKLVNDSLGHESGDRLLVSISRRLENSLRESDSLVCRLGGDEFAIIIEDIESIDTPIKIANRIISSVSSPIGLGGGREVFASVSVGISVSNDEFENASQMLQAADTAMYRAKEEGKSCYRVFDPAMKEVATKRLDLENELRRAVEGRELFLHYQPIVELANARLVGFEALVRWNNPRIGAVSPAEFIPIAEETGLIVPIGRQVLEEACRQMAEWKATDLRFEKLRISVNLSSRQLQDAGLADEVIATLKETNLPPTDLRLEVTESSIMKNPEQGACVLSTLRQHGVKVAIDDFGTGYSSLSYIHELSPDVVKIDRSFVDKITTSSDKETIVGAILALAERLNLDVVAEGVETEAQRKVLTSMGCVYGQGFLFAKPLGPLEVEQFVARPQQQVAAEQSQ